MAHGPERKKFDELTEKRITVECLNDIQALREIYQHHNCECHPRLDLEKIRDNADVLSMLALLLHEECMTLEASCEKFVAIPVGGGKPEVRESIFSGGVLKSLMTVLAHLGDPRCRHAYAVGKDLLPSNVTAMRTDYCAHISACKSKCTLLDGTACNGLKFDCPAYRQKT